MSTVADHPRIERRIFVVGVPRSGTTLVQSLLAAHGQLTSFTESHFFSRHFKILPGTSRPLLIENPAPRVREFLAENDFPTYEELADLEALPAGPLLPTRTQAVARRLLDLLDTAAVSRGARGWIEKTPKHLRYVPFLESLTPAGVTTQCVHVVRGGLEVVASLHKASQQWSHPYDLDTCVRRWNEDLRFSLNRLSKDTFVFYEALTAQPEATLRRLLADLGVPWEPGMLQRFGDSSERLITEDESWKFNIGREVRPSATSGDVLSPEQRRRVEKALDLDLYDRLLQGSAP